MCGEGHKRLLVSELLALVGVGGLLWILFWLACGEDRYPLLLHFLSAFVIVEVCQSLGGVSCVLMKRFVPCIL